MRWLATGAIAALVTGCGLSTPELQPPFKTYQDEEITITHIVNRVKCELIHGVINTMNDDSEQARLNARLGGSRKLEWLKNWSAKVTLTLTALESSALNPNFTYFNPLENAMLKFSNGTITRSRAFTVGFGGSISSAATRTDKLDFFFAFKDFLPEEDPATGMLRSGGPDTDIKVPCDAFEAFLASDLKLDEWMKEAVAGVYNESIKTQKGFTLPIAVISHEVQFLVMQNANVNPGFILTNWLFSQAGSPLLQAVRNRTDDVLITLGPTAQAEYGPQKPPGAPTTPPQPSQAVVNSHLASEIGLAVSAAIRNIQTTQP
jgi:hypothetical protein